MIADIDGDLKDFLNVNTPDEVPVLALRNMVLFPGVVTPILIGRESSKKLVTKAERKGLIIGVVAQLDPDVDYPNIDDLYRVGVYAKVMKLLTLPNGNITAIVQGLGRLQLDEIVSTSPYLEAKVTPLEEIQPEKKDREFKTAIGDLRDMVNKYISMSDEIPDEANFAIKNISNDVMVLNFVCTNLPFNYKEKQALLDKFSDREAYLAQLTERRDKIKSRLLELCKKASDIRKREASVLADSIREALIDLNFLDVRFEISVTADEDQPGSTGYDSVEFLISTNPGEKLRPLADVASGGELSRIMLALKTVLAARDSVGTLIFDEIDSGISGRTAQKVSEKLKQLSKERQVICITHLPQIAAMADSHFEIRKEVEGTHTKTIVDELDEEASIRELARMLGGVEITESVINNAKEMKTLANRAV